VAADLLATVTLTLFIYLDLSAAAHMLKAYGYNVVVAQSNGSQTPVTSQSNRTCNCRLKDNTGCNDDCTETNASNYLSL